MWLEGYGGPLGGKGVALGGRVGLGGGGRVWL